ncbi:MAG: C4-dicarboxylic acid transporter DauA [Phycisphaerales bacterium]|nr:C4-dicarboxylic acid transporter DauA [Phycisphaerales bacterium]MCI0629070.1 C4-dicarboxylic acid transporter DauA [Phycisphaerales bacterium]MCI0675632.1 C4-dicarboxylic acid transporter DauA [Phycisphaerales bacterium]
MPTRIEAHLQPSTAPRPRLAYALRQALAEGYTKTNLRADILAGLVVGIVALPLSMALAIASGVPPQHGIYTAIIAGAVIALLGGSRVQVSGPTAAFVVILAPISAKFGIAGLLIASMIAGVMLLLMGLLRFGRFIQFIPYPVTAGFTAGIAVVISTLQLKDFLGLDLGQLPEHFIEKVAALIGALPTFHWPDLAIGIATLTLLLVWPRITRKIPAPLVALPLTAIAAFLIASINPDLSVATVYSRFDGIPQSAPSLAWPWQFPGPNGESLAFDFSTIRALLVAAFAIAMLGAIESLLSAVVADGMTGYTHEPNSELIAQGVGNIVAPFFGGFAATGAIARTATNIRSGGRSPVSAIVHAAFLLIAVLGLAPLLGYLPMAALAALLLIVAKNMADIKHFAYMIRVAPLSDVTVMLTCFSLTVVFDMVIAVCAGIVLAAILFMRRMAEVSNVKLIGDHHPQLAEPLPKGALLYEINGPLFFGAAQKAMSSLHTVGNGVKLVILDMEDVPAMDATGLVNLQSTIKRLHSDHILIILGGVRPQPMEVLTKARLEQLDSRIGICPTLHEAVTMARFHLALGDDLHQPSPITAAA